MPRLTDAQKRARVRERNKLARIVNARMKEIDNSKYALSQLKHKPWGANAYAKKRISQIYRGKGYYGKRKRHTFRTSGGWDSKVNSEISAMRDFLSMSTSSVNGIETKFMKEKKTLEERYDITFADEQHYMDFKKIMDDKNLEKLMDSKPRGRLSSRGYSYDEFRHIYNDFNKKSGWNVTLDEVAKAFGYKNYIEMDNAKKKKIPKFKIKRK